jgi:hypothetical protein
MLMKRAHWSKLVSGFAVLCGLFFAPEVLAQREVHWQINPKGFPSETSIFVDVEEGGSFRRDLPPDSFSVSMDEFAGEDGGWILNKQQVAAGWAGAQVLIIVDVSASYTAEFDRAKRVLRTLVNFMESGRDQVAIGTAPATGFSEARLEQPFTSDKNAVLASIDKLRSRSENDQTAARFCQAITTGLKWFPDQVKDKYRVVVFVTGGADKDEGNSDCVKDSFAAGLVPVFPMVFKLNRKYDDPRREHKIENAAHDLAKATGGRYMFRRSEEDFKQFAGLIWNRIRSQYHLLVTFPCYYPEPKMEHVSVLKVQGRDANHIQFQAPSQKAPQPQITALYPPSATRQDIDNGKVDLTIDGQGFCGKIGQLRLSIGGIPVSPKSQNPYRMVVPLNSTIDGGTISVANIFAQTADSPMKFEVVARRGQDASVVLVVIVLLLVVLGVAAVALMAMRSRKAKIPPGGGVRGPIVAPPPASTPGTSPALAAKASSGAAKTVAMTGQVKAWIERSDGRRQDLQEGENLIGREETCQIHLNVTGVSREHARLTFVSQIGLLTLEDLGSTNGTFCGPADAEQKDLKRLQVKQPVHNGEVVWIGGERMVVHIESASA